MKALRFLAVIVAFFVALWLTVQIAVLVAPKVEEPGPDATLQEQMAFFQEVRQKIQPFLIGGLIGGLVIGFVAARITNKAIKSWQEKREVAKGKEQAQAP